jgi:hypothetical protein
VVFWIVSSFKRNAIEVNFLPDLLILLLFQMLLLFILYVSPTIKQSPIYRKAYRGIASSQLKKLIFDQTLTDNAFFGGEGDDVNTIR